MALGKTDRYLRNVAIVLGLAWMAIGCGPQTIGFVAQSFFPNMAEPKCKLSHPDKEITVVIAPRFEKLEIRPDVQPMDYELADGMALEMRKLFKESREKVKIVPPLRVKPHLNRLKDWDAPELVKVGEHFQADYVIALSIQNPSLVKPSSFNSLYEGKADVDVAVYDVHMGALEAKIFNGQFRCNYPKTRPIELSEVSPPQFRALFVSRMARDLSRWFAPYESNQKFDID